MFKYLLVGCAISGLVGCAGESDTGSGTDDFTGSVQFDSFYSSLQDCPRTEVEPSFWHARCDGVGVWKILIQESGPHQDVAILNERDQFDLDVRTALAGVSGPTTYSPKAEWRVRRDRQEPSAVILPFSIGQRGFLAVAKVSREKSCVVKLVETNKDDANELARQAADLASDAACPEVPSVE
ncbi:MAG TPA: hypothetical protein VM925_24940 [Labilithrix sp.]|nr:hypothetical protein [Labilithrix sp.]